jgi:hypothetical protein
MYSKGVIADNLPDGATVSRPTEGPFGTDDLNEQMTDPLGGVGGQIRNVFQVDAAATTIPAAAESIPSEGIIADGELILGAGSDTECVTGRLLPA